MSAQSTGVREPGSTGLGGPPASPRTATAFSVFPSSEARAEMLALYDAKLADWPVPFDELDIPGRFGTTHLVVAGDPAAPPLVLLHMTCSPSFVWAPIIASLTAIRRVYAVDTVGDVGKSVLRNRELYPRNGPAYAAWLSEVLDGVGLDTADVIAGSHGGWIGMHFTANAPARVRRLVLLVPMGLASWPRMLNVLARMSTFALGTMTTARIEVIKRWLMGDTPQTEALIGDWLARIIRGGFSPKLGPPLPVPGATRRSIRAPTLVVLGGEDQLVGNARAAAHRATDTIPDVEIEIVPSGTHAVHIEQPERVAHRITTFLTH